MGIVNATPDSFSDGGEFVDPGLASGHARKLIGQGADVIDIGGESTRPGAEAVPPEVELRRIEGVIGRLADVDAALSVDTYKPEVARTALGMGVEVINDVSGCADPEMVEVVAGTGCGVVLVHMKASPGSAHIAPAYDDVASEVEQLLLQRSQILIDAGIDPARIAIDPGIGFGKNADHNLEILHRVDRLASHGFPVVLGASRKRFLRLIAGAEDGESLDQATAITTALGFAGGARVFRVHNPRSSGRALALSGAIVRGRWQEWLQGSNPGGSPGS